MVGFPQLSQDFWMCSHTYKWWTILNSKGSWHILCFCLGLFPHEASHLSGNQADWRFCVSRESQGNVLTGSLFQVPLGKKQVAEEEPPPGLGYSCSFLCLPGSLEVCGGLLNFPLRWQHLHERTFLGTLPTCLLDSENSSWAFAAKQKPLLSNHSSVYTCRGREFNFLSCLESRLLNNDLRLAPGLSLPTVFVDSSWESLVTFVKFYLSFLHQSYFICLLSSQNFYKILVHWWYTFLVSQSVMISFI